MTRGAAAARAMRRETHCSIAVSIILLYHNFCTPGGRQRIYNITLSTRETGWRVSVTKKQHLPPRASRR